MLKVIGASWAKTRISTLILLCACILAICALILAGMERPKFDGTYCATVYWQKQYGFRIEFWGQRNDLEKVPKGVARICYKDTILENGWAQIELETQSEYPDKVQATAAGILEGALTWNNIYNHWTNTINSYCEYDEDNESFCNWLKDIIYKNYELTKLKAETYGDNDHYWHQVRLFYYQLEGLEYGWRKGVKRSRADHELEFHDFLILNAGGDFRDLRKIYDILMENEVDESDSSYAPAKGSMVLKVLEENNWYSALLFGHSSDGHYSEMLRVLKKYKFGYHESSLHGSQQIVPGEEITFTGYPGILASIDDFYMIEGEKVHFAIAGIKVMNRNLDLWISANLEEDFVPLPARVMAANRLANNPRAWSRVMAKDPCTGSKQWMVADLTILEDDNILNDDQINDNLPPEASVQAVHKPKNGSMTVSGPNTDGSSTTTPSNVDPDEIGRSKKNFIWIVDQLPGRLHAEDISHLLSNQNGFWYFTGLPFFKETLKMGKFSQEEHYESQLNIDQNITDLSQIDHFLRTHAYRGDLVEAKDAYGNIDMKLISVDRDGDVEFYATAGPPYSLTAPNAKLVHHATREEVANLMRKTDEKPREQENLKESHNIRQDPNKVKYKIYAPFKWSKSLLDVQHEGHPDKWKFDRVSPIWAW